MRVSGMRIATGVFLILIGVLWLLEMLGIIHFNICLLGPVVLIAAGVALLVSKHTWFGW